MTKVMDEVLAQFFERLSESDAVDGPTVKSLKELFESKSKLRADDFVAVFEAPAEEATGDSD